jgi:predicted Fe-Mo cluster-binding NifX family protein
MKIAVSSSGKDLDSQVDPRFGRCAYFVIVETDDMSFEAFDNENVAAGGGAGIQSAQFVASKDAKAVITGNCGPNAMQTLSASRVEVFVGQSGSVREVIERYRRGDMKSTSTHNVTDHYGTGGGAGMGRGMGKGLGIGRSGTGGSKGKGKGNDQGSR